MAEPRRSAGRPADEQGAIRRLDVEVVRFDVVRLPSGLYTHRTSKVIIPVRPRPAR